MPVAQVLVFCKVVRRPVHERPLAETRMARSEHLPRPRIDEDGIFGKVLELCVQKVFFSQELVFVVEHVRFEARSVPERKPDRKKNGCDRGNDGGPLRIDKARFQEIFQSERHDERKQRKRDEDIPLVDVDFKRARNIQQNDENLDAEKKSQDEATPVTLF